jgi:peptidoglycan/LPS O-acetylase OafA/YrhL
MKYRADIQILRGFSAIAVVGYHLAIPGFQSGFFGVDIFFTISGYLMAVFFKSGRAKEFFGRRATRILPAYFLTIVATLLFSAFVTIPIDFRQVVDQSEFAVVLSSNIGFWLTNSYFEQNEFPVLLHLWSLGVELQFYLFVPGIAWLAARSRFALPILFCGSLAACLIFLGISPKTSFFMMPLRLWEFIVGFAVATQLSNDGAIRTMGKSYVGAIAAVILVALVVTYTDPRALNCLSGHPGLRAVAASLATGSILAFGFPSAGESSLVGRAFENLGKYSYSIYMAHFPLIVLFIYKPFANTHLAAITTAQAAVLSLLTAVASLLLYHLVEVPGRRSHHILKFLWVAPVLVILIAGVGLTVQYARYSPREHLIFDAFIDRSTYRCGKMARLSHLASISCELTKPQVSPTHVFFLVGNSHADSIKTAFASEAEETKSTVWFLVENQPLLKGGITPQRLIDESLARGVQTIVLHFSLGSLEPGAVRELVDLAEKGHLRVAIIMPVPVWQRSIPEALWKNMTVNDPLPKQSLSDYQAANRVLSEELSSIHSGSFKVYEVGSVFCHDACEFISDAGKPLYFDGGHLTLTGADLLRPVFARIIEESIIPAPRAF